jgi:hypothetical protein
LRFLFSIFLFHFWFLCSRLGKGHGVVLSEDNIMIEGEANRKDGCVLPRTKIPSGPTTDELPPRAEKSPRARKKRKATMDKQ